MLVSAVHQHEAAIGVRVIPPPWTSLPPPSPSPAPGSHRAVTPGSPGHSANSHQLCTLHTVTRTFPCCSLKSPTFSLLPCPPVCYLCLHLHCCLQTASSGPSSRFHTYVCFLLASSPGRYVHEHSLPNPGEDRLGKLEWRVCVPLLEPM